MNMEQIVSFYQSYSLPSVIIALTISIILLVLDKILKSKFPIEIRGIVPFVLGVLFNAIYDFIFISHALSFPEQTVSAGLICGSLSTVFYSLIKKILKSKSIGDCVNISVDPVYLSVESIINGVVPEQVLDKATKAIVEILSENITDDEKIIKITRVLSTFVTEQTDEKLKEIAKIIVIAKNNIHLF